MLSYSPAYNLNNSGFNPIAIFIRSPGLEKSAMSPMDRGDQPDECVALQCRSEEHRVWDEWIILRGDNGRGHGYGVQHMAGARTVVVVGSVAIAAVRSRIAIIKITDPIDGIQPIQVPFVRRQCVFSPHAGFELDEEVTMIDPIAGAFQFSDTERRIDIRADGNRAGQ